MTVIHTRSSKCFIKIGGEWVEIGKAVQSMQELAKTIQSLNFTGTATIRSNKELNVKKPIENDWYKRFDKKKF